MFGDALPPDLAQEIARDQRETATMALQIPPQALNAMDERDLWRDPHTFRHGPFSSSGSLGFRSRYGQSLNYGALFRDRLLALLLCRRRDNTATTKPFRLAGLPQSPKSLHVLADFIGLPLQFGHRSRTIFPGQTLPVGTRSTFGGRLGRFPVAHVSSRLKHANTRSTPGIERAAPPFQYIREMAWPIKPATNSRRLIYRASYRS